MTDLKEIIMECKDAYGLNTENNETFNLNFLDRQMQIHPFYDLDKELERNDLKTEKSGKKQTERIYFNLVKDKLYIVNCMMGNQEVTNHFHKKIIISKEEDLKLLRADGTIWYDRTLGSIWAIRAKIFTLYTERGENRIIVRNDYNLMTYVDILKELIKDSEVIKKWGELDYDKIRKGEKAGVIDTHSKITHSTINIY
jgi:hypothetical protein